MSPIKQISASEILDSRGNPTIETSVLLADGSLGVASVPSGSSTGKYEAFEMRDGDPDRYNGMGVKKAVRNVEEIIAPALSGKDPSSQDKIDYEMLSLDGTDNKSKLGGNAILSVSLAVAKAAAGSDNQPLFLYLNNLAEKYKLPEAVLKIPTPIFNIINGGKHGAGNLDFQEFQIIPSVSGTYSQSLEMGDEVYQALKKVLTYRGAIHSVGDEGGFAPNLFTNADALDILIEAVTASEHEINREIFLGLDLASSYFYKEGRYLIKDRPEPFEPGELIEFYRNLVSRYRLVSLEDPFDEDAWNDWTAVTKKLGRGVMIIGDDLLVTNPKRLKKAVAEQAANSILVKPNQIGTLSEVFDVVRLARESDWKVIISHRSGETNDTFIADLAVALGADFVKFGAPARGERVAKYNRLSEIEKSIT